MRHLGGETPHPGGEGTRIGSILVSLSVIGLFIVFSVELFEWSELVVFYSILIPEVEPSLNLWLYLKKLMKSSKILVI